jgi:hypothetical protein
MAELTFLGIAAAAGTFKLAALVIGVVLAFQAMAARGIPLKYRRSRSSIPFRPVGGKR